EGNAFFVEEILRHLMQEGIVYHDGHRWTAHATPEEMRLPSAVSDILSRGLARVSEQCRRVLSVASVIGRQFDIAAVTHLSDLPREQVCELFDEAVAVRAISRVRGPLRDYLFSQETVRGMLYGAIPTLARAELHRRAGEYLEEKNAGRLDAIAS